MRLSVGASLRTTNPSLSMCCSARAVCPVYGQGLSDIFPYGFLAAEHLHQKEEGASGNIDFRQRTGQIVRVQPVLDGELADWGFLLEFRYPFLKQGFLLCQNIDISIKPLTGVVNRRKHDLGLLALIPMNAETMGVLRRCGGSWLGGMRFHPGGLCPYEGRSRGMTTVTRVPFSSDVSMDTSPPCALAMIRAE